MDIYPSSNLQTKRLSKFLANAITSVIMPQISIINDSHFTALVFFKIMLEGTSKRI